jgi:hypothetical protein
MFQLHRPEAERLRAAGRKSLAQLFADSPFKGLDIDFERDVIMAAIVRHERLSSGHQHPFRTNPPESAPQARKRPAKCMHPSANKFKPRPADALTFDPS